MAMEIAQIHGDDHPTARESECNGHRWKCGVLRDDREHYSTSERASSGRSRFWAVRRRDNECNTLQRVGNSGLKTRLSSIDVATRARPSPTMKRAPSGRGDRSASPATRELVRVRRFYRVLRAPRTPLLARRRPRGGFQQSGSGATPRNPTTAHMRKPLWSPILGQRVAARLILDHVSYSRIGQHLLKLLLKAERRL